MTILIDTNVLIDYTKGHGRALETLLEKQAGGEVELVLNPVIVAEFLTDQSLAKKDTLVQAHEFLALFGSVDLTKKMGIIAGELLRTQNVSSLGDGLIAATCLANDFSLATRNKRHFQKIRGLQFVAMESDST